VVLADSGPDDRLHALPCGHEHSGAGPDTRRSQGRSRDGASKGIYRGDQGKGRTMNRSCLGDMMADWTHDALMEDLAAHLTAPARMVWMNMQLGPSGSPRPDVFTIAKSYVNPRPTSYECKISRSDFRADVTIGKWASYLEYSHSVIFAIPHGLIDKREIPDQCGLIVRHETSWRLSKGAIVNPHPIAQEALIKLLIDGVHREGPRVRSRYWNNYDVTRKFAKKFGTNAARYISDIARAEEDSMRIIERNQEAVKAAELRAKEIVERATEDAPKIWKELIEVLRIPDNSNIYAVERAVSDLRRKSNGHPANESLQKVIFQLQRIIDNNRPEMDWASG
jgi:hypothetical protein